MSEHLLRQQCLWTSTAGVSDPSLGILSVYVGWLFLGGLLCSPLTTTHFSPLLCIHFSLHHWVCPLIVSAFSWCIMTTALPLGFSYVWFSLYFPIRVPKGRNLTGLLSFKMSAHWLTASEWRPNLGHHPLPPNCSHSLVTKSPMI